ncbi:MAG: hypothetical protein COA73_02420 [Candidatus Hydrogenedentota bacterium]|nr:MAG: hypothetical protein COA73_02420 [Candidatus Hydrogenedentota bacterium]
MSEETSTIDAEETEVIENEEVTTEAGDLQKGLRNVVKAQKIAIDAVVEQTDRTANYVKNRYDMEENHTGAAVINATKDGVERIASIQKGMLDAAEERVERRIEARIQKKEEAVEKSASRKQLRGLAKNSVVRFLDGQEEMINLGQKQSKLMLEGLERVYGLRPAGLMRGATRYTGKAIRNVIETQERFLEINASYVKANRDLITDDAETENTLSDFAYDGVENVIEASKQILDVAKEQTDVTVEKFASENTDTEEDTQKNNEWANLAEDGVERVVKGQRAALDFSREVVKQIFSN